ncbi:MAG: GNAT family N-acetyltransferase [Pseudomonadota bacterium]
MRIDFYSGELTKREQQIVADGFRAHSERRAAPQYRRDRFKWLGLDDDDELRGVLTAETLWDWLYVDELWVDSVLRGTGLGKRLMQYAEDHARSRDLVGVWLWTQSWQAETFYRHLGYEEFARFDDFPRGHVRIGFRKQLA